jgi:hypothetical protein
MIKVTTLISRLTVSVSFASVHELSKIALKNTKDLTLSVPLANQFVKKEWVGDYV